MIRLLALAWLLVLLPLPLSSLAALAAQAPAEEGAAGMAARPHFVVEAGVRVPAAASASVASRLALPVAVTSAPPRPLRHAPWLGGSGEVTRPATRLALLGRLQLDGG